MGKKAHSVEYVFHNVGQGLFASGTLFDIDADATRKNRFQWVYDCGTTSSRSLLDNAIKRFISNPFVKDRAIGLMALSHFDSDHIDGVVALLREVKVDVLLLPYLPLTQRLLLALAQGIGAGDRLLPFFIDPIAYLRAADIAGIERVVFVGPEYRGPDDESGEDPAASDENTEMRDGDGTDRLRFRSRPIGDIEPALEGKGRTAGSVGEARMLDAGSALRVGQIWEFVPYNDRGRLGSVTTEFLQEARSHADELLQASDAHARQVALTALKLLYDRKFGSSPVDRNVISLFLYAGPIDRQSFDICYADIFGHSGIYSSSQRLLMNPFGIGDAACRSSILYTGDGYLDSPERIDALRNCLGQLRFGAISVLQVMHHGARGNWMPGVAREIKPIFSVFSSDPGARRPGHPHAEVLRDFWLYGPVQVDATHNVEIFFRGLGEFE